jgi:hypothetical protein
MLSGMAFHAADTHRATSEGAARKGRLKEMCGLEPRTNFFFFFLIGKSAYSTWWGNLKKDRLEELGIDGRISQRSLKKERDSE